MEKEKKRYKHAYSVGYEVKYELEGVMTSAKRKHYTEALRRLNKEIAEGKVRRYGKRS